MDYLSWILVAVIALIVIAAVAIVIVRVWKMPVEERKKVICHFLTGLVTAAEALYEGEGRGKEKLKWVEEQFQKTAPWFLKLLLTVTKTADLDELIELALKEVKGAFGQ